MPELSLLDTVSACDQGAELEIKHPVTGKGMGMFLTLVGVDSARFVAATDRLAERRYRNAMKKNAAAQEFKMSQSREENIEMLADCTLGWRGFEKDGAPIPFSREAVIDLYTNYPVARDQANAFIGDLGNFLRDLPEPSAQS